MTNVMTGISLSDFPNPDRYSPVEYFVSFTLRRRAAVWYIPVHRKADFWVAWHSGYLPDFQFPKPGMPSHHPPWRSDILLRRGIFVLGVFFHHFRKVR